VNAPVSSIAQCLSGQHTLAHKVCPACGHWHVPFTQISASRQPAKHPPQFSVVFRETHLPPQQPSPSAHTLPQRPQLNRSKTTFVHTPRQRRSSGEGHRPRPSGGAAQAMPGMEASAVPNSMPPTIRRALRRGIVPSASALDSSSKECSMLTSSRLLAATGSSFPASLDDLLPPRKRPLKTSVAGCATGSARSISAHISEGASKLLLVCLDLSVS